MTHSLTVGHSPQVTDEIQKKLRLLVRERIAPFASPDYIQEASALPKTRSGKIMRRILRKIAAGDADLGDTSTMADESIIPGLQVILKGSGVGGGEGNWARNAASFRLVLPKDRRFLNVCSSETCLNFLFRLAGIRSWARLRREGGEDLATRCSLENAEKKGDPTKEETKKNRASFLHSLFPPQCSLAKVQSIIVYSMSLTSPPRSSP